MFTHLRWAPRFAFLPEFSRFIFFLLGVVNDPDARKAGLPLSKTSNSKNFYAIELFKAVRNGPLMQGRDVIRRITPKQGPVLMDPTRPTFLIGEGSFGKRRERGLVLDDNIAFKLDIYTAVNFCLNRKTFR